MAAPLLDVSIDVVVVAVVGALGAYGSRSLLTLLRHEELAMMKPLWVPILASGFFFFVWAVEVLLFELYPLGDTVIDFTTQATLLVGILCFSVGVMRFSRIWLDYTRKAHGAAEPGAAISQ